MKKNYLNLFLSAVALLYCMVASAHDFEVDGIFYNITDESAKTVEVTFKGNEYNSYTDEYSGEVVVPETVEYHGYTYTVTAIGEYAFYDCDYLTNVKLPNTIVQIKGKAFRKMDSFENLVIPASVESLGSYALSNINGLSKLEIPSNVTNIGSHVVAYVDDLKSLYIGHGVQTVPEEAVCYSTSWSSGSNVLNTVYLGSNITSIQSGAFGQQIGITKLYCMAPTPPSVVDAGYNYKMYSNSDAVLYVPYGTRNVYHTATFWDKFPSIVELDYFVVDGISYRVTSEIAATCEVTFDGTTYDEFTQEYVGDIVVPSTVVWGGKQYTVTSVGANAFNGCTSLASVTLPPTVTSIGEYAFYNCPALEKLVLPSSVTDIAGYAFSGSTRNIKDIYAFMPQPAELLASTFHSDLYNKTVLHTPQGAGELYGAASYWKNFKNIDELGYFEVDGLYYNVTSAATLTCEFVKSTVEYTGDVNIPSSVEYNGVTYSVTAVGDGAFNDATAVTNVTLPESVVSIGMKAFAGCTNIKTLHIPSKVVTIDASAFYGCALDSLVSHASKAPAITELSLAGISPSTLLVYPAGSDYSSWTPYFGKIVEAGSSALSVNYPFYIGRADGLPGNGTLDGQLFWESPLYNFDTEKDGVRITVFENSSGELYNGFPLVALGELEFYDENGCKIEYAIGDVSTNSLEVADGKLAALNDGDYSTHYHSTYTANGTKPTDYVYVDVKFMYPLSSYKIKWFVRQAGTKHNPTYVGVTNSGEASVPNAVQEGSCGDDSFWSYFNGTLVINGTGAVSSNPWSVYMNNIKTIYIEEGITELPAYLFCDYVNLECVSLPSTLTAIGNLAFGRCSNLASVITAATVAPSLGSDAFSGISENAVLTIPADSDYTLWEPYFSAFRGDNAESIAALKVLLANAQVLHDSNVEGDNVGEYVKGSKAALQAVIDELQAVVSDDMLNTEVENCTAKINAAINTFKSRVNSDYPNSIKLENVAAHAGEQVVVAVNMDNVDEIRGFQFDMFLPAGVTFAVDEDGYELIELSEERASRLHSFRNNIQADGSMRVLCYANSSAVFSGNDGAVLYITLNVAEEMLDGDYVVETRNIALVGSGGVEYNIPLTASSITIESYIMGDVNKDGRVSVSDITTVVDAILYESTDTAYDVNGDSRVSVSDITTVVDIILNEGASAASKAPARVATRSSSNLSLYIDPFEINAGEEKEILVNLSNPGTEITAVEFDLFLPAGLEVVSDEYGYYVLPGSRTPNKRVPHSVSSDLLSSGAIHVICYHNGQLAFTGEDGDVLAITIKAAEDLEPGNYTIDLKNIELVNPADPKNGILISDNNTVVTDIENIEAEEEGTAEIYDLSGRRVNNLVKGIYIVNGKKVVK